MRIGVLIFGIILIIVGFGLSGSMSESISYCQSFTGNVVQFFDSSAGSQCSTYNFLLIVGYGILIMGALLFLVGIFGSKKHIFQELQVASTKTYISKGKEIPIYNKHGKIIGYRAK